MKTIILTVQLVTYLAFGILFLVEGSWRLGIAQLLLIGVQALLFST